METRSRVILIPAAPSRLDATDTVPPERIILPYPGPTSEKQQLRSYIMYRSSSKLSKGDSASQSKWESLCNLARQFYYSHGLCSVGLTGALYIPDEVLLPEGCLNDRAHLVAIMCEFLLRRGLGSLHLEDSSFEQVGESMYSLSWLSVYAVSDSPQLAVVLCSFSQCTKAWLEYNTCTTTSPLASII